MAKESQPVAITARQLLVRLQEAGIVPDKTRRVIIDLPYDDGVSVYYEVVGDERLAEIDLPAMLHRAGILPQHAGKRKGA